MEVDEKLSWNKKYWFGEIGRTKDWKMLDSNDFTKSVFPKPYTRILILESCPNRELKNPLTF